MIAVTLDADSSLIGCDGDDSIHIASDQMRALQCIDLTLQQDCGALWNAPTADELKEPGHCDRTFKIVGQLFTA